MGKPAKTSWDFGELFTPEQIRRVFTVAELTAQLRRLLEQQFVSIWVTGEISNLRAQSSGHLYFTLKDAAAQLNCVLFRSERATNRELLQDGQKVVLGGDLTVYEPRGQYQLRVTAIELQGLGALQAAFERLKRKLEAEGLFDQARKRPLPRYPQRIGLVTSPTGAAIRDVLHVIGRRHPGLEIILVPCRVQGEGAAAEISAGIRLLNEWSSQQVAAGCAGLDLILVTRGGGSLEDLWAFNEEGIARAIFISALPVVSAIGHEIDFTICDFVADVRAATPSAAAEIITEAVFASRQFLGVMSSRMRQQIRQRFQQSREQLRLISRQFQLTHPQRRLADRLQWLDDLEAALTRGFQNHLRHRRTVWTAMQQRWLALHPSDALARRWGELSDLEHAMSDRARLRFERLGHRLKHAYSRLELLSPSNVLRRGYSITMDAATGEVLRRASAVAARAQLRTRLQEGEIRSVAEG